MATPSDTPAAVERMLIDGFRRMSPGAKLRRVAAMNRALEQLARARCAPATDGTCPSASCASGWARCGSMRT